MQGELQAKLTDIKTEIGERLYPVAEKIFNKIIEFTNTEEFSTLLNTIYDSVDKIANSVLEFINSGRLETYIQWLTDNLPTLGTKISEVAGKISDTIDKAWSLVDALSNVWSAVSDRGGENLDSWLAQGRQYGGGGGWIGNRASGGSVSAGRMYRVNDDAGRRTEWFIPSQNGYVLNGNQTDRIMNSVNNSRNFSGGIQIYVNSYGMNVAEVADELGAAFQQKIRMSGAML